MKAALAFVFFFVLVSYAQAQELNVRLTINNVQNNVYIPGTGEIASDSLGSGTVYSSPDHFYIASYFNNLMYALVGATGTGLFARTSGGTHTIAINQSLQGSKVLMGFTSGDWNNIDSVISSIESGSLFQEIAPSLSFGLGYLNPIKILLAYTNINITGDLRLHSGFRKLIVSNEGFENNVPQIRIESP